MDWNRKAEVGSGNRLGKLIVLYSFFVFFIILNVMDFLERMPPMLDFVKKIMSWTFLGLLLYNADLSKVFFGEKSNKTDVALIISYFAFIVKDFVQYASTILAGVSMHTALVADKISISYFLGPVEKGIAMPQILMRFYENVTGNPLIPMIAMILGFMAFIIIGFVVTKKTRIGFPSVANIMGEEGHLEHGLWNFLKRFLKLEFIILAFYVVLFNLMMEWLAIAVDAPLVVVALIVYFMFGRGLSLGERLSKIGSFGEKFYEEFVQSFSRKETVYWALAGMLVLHILTDVANYIVPYIFVVRDSLYSVAIESTSVIALFKESIQGLPLFSQIQIAGGYILNVIGVLMLMIAPGIVWYRVHNKKDFNMKPIWLGLFVSSVLYFLLNPVFVLGSLGLQDTNLGAQLIGAKISIQPLAFNPLIFYVVLGVGFLTFLLSFIEIPRKIVIFVWLVMTQLFFLRYIYSYVVSAFFQYKETLWGIIIAIPDAMPNVQYLILYPLLIFWGLVAVLTGLFYIIGSLSFIAKSWKE